MPNKPMARGVYVADKWSRLDLCPTCGAKTGERCLRRTKSYERICLTPHKVRPHLPQYQRLPK